MDAINIREGESSMTQINLLPWREQTRKIKKTQFITASILSVCISLFILLMFHLHLSNVANQQQELNDILEASINEQQNALNEMNSKEQEKVAIDVQLQFISDLYNESYHAVRVLNELVTLVPNSISIKQIKRNGNEITLTGMANSENDVSSFMSVLAKSPYFNQPVLSSISLQKNFQENATQFKLMFLQKG
jgi:type IV pilus assembly protein PilN